MLLYRKGGRISPALMVFRFLLGHGHAFMPMAKQKSQSDRKEAAHYASIYA